MATQPRFRRWTYEDFARLPQDGGRHEIITGDLFVTPAPMPSHQELVARLVELMRPFARKHELGRILPGPIDVLFAEGDYLEPDLVFVRAERTHIISKRGVEAAPDLVIEIVSPTTGMRDRGIKRERYAHFGVPEYWVVDPAAEQIEVYRAAGEAPEVFSETLCWQPSGAGPVLEISMTLLFSDLD